MSDNVKQFPSRMMSIEAKIDAMVTEARAKMDAELRAQGARDALLDLAKWCREQRPDPDGYDRDRAVERGTWLLAADEAERRAKEMEKP